MNHQTIHTELEEAWGNRRQDLRGSFQLANEQLPLLKKKNDEKGMAECHKILSYCYWRFSDYSMAMDHALRALRLFKILKDLKGEADSLNNLGAVYMFQKDNEKRLDCNMKCLVIRQKLGDASDISGSMNNIGETYLDLKDYSSAKKWFVECLELENAGEDSVAWALHNLGKLYLVEENHLKSEESFLQSLEISERNSYFVLTTETLLQLGGVYKERGDNLKAIHYAGKAVELAKNTGSREDENAAQLLIAQTKELLGDHIGALEHYKEYHRLYMEIHNQTNIQAIKDLQFQYQLEKIRQKAEEAELEKIRTIELQKAYDQIRDQSRLLEERNNEILESIRYAQRIQEAVLVEKKHISSHLPEHFIYFRPKDIVSGDFYWAQEKEGFLYVAAADCTGHGVPGGFLTMLGIAFLNEILSQKSLLTPAQILGELRDKFIKELRLQDSSNDGMDISLVRLEYHQDNEINELLWAGANNPLWVVSNEGKKFTELKADKQPIGKSDIQKPFTDTSLQLKKGDLVYLFSDGYHDQFGGQNGKKLKKSGFKELILSLSQLSINEQNVVLGQHYEKWKGIADQVDDVCVMGLRI
ncbi:MAG: tetratricopeptide repeat protein [Flavobacteriia bacterium]